MTDNSIFFIAAFLLFAAVSIGVILVLWIAMPFSVFGVKSLLKKALDEQAETNRLLRALLELRRDEGGGSRPQDGAAAPGNPGINGFTGSADIKDGRD